MDYTTEIPDKPAPKVAAPIGEYLAEFNIPRSTFHKETQRSGAPKTFKIGRRIYILRDDFEDWLRKLSQAANA